MGSSTKVNEGHRTELLMLCIQPSINWLFLKVEQNWTCLQTLTVLIHHSSFFVILLFRVVMIFIDDNNKNNSDSFSFSYSPTTSSITTLKTKNHQILGYIKHLPRIAGFKLRQFRPRPSFGHSSSLMLLRRPPWDGWSVGRAYQLDGWWGPLKSLLCSQPNTPEKITRAQGS